MKFCTTQKEYYTQHTHIFWIKPVFVCAKLDCTTIMDNEMRNDIEMVNHFYWFLFFLEILFWSFFSFVVIGYAPFCFCFPFEIIVNNLFAIFLVVLLRQQSAIIPILFCCCFFLLNLLLPSSLKVCLLRCHFPHKSFWLPFAALFLPRKNKCSNKTSLSLSLTHTLLKRICNWFFPDLFK